MLIERFAMSLGVDPFVLLGLFAATTLLAYIDMPLPKADSPGVSGALNAIAVQIFGAPLAVVVGVTGMAIALGLRRRSGAASQVNIEIAAIVAGFTGAALIQSLRSLLPASGTIAGLYATTLAVAAAYLVLELAAVQLVSRARWSALLLVAGKMRGMASLIAAQASACLLAVTVYPVLGAWSLLLVVALLLLIRQSYTLLFSIRETYWVTMKVIVEAAELTDGRWRGHSERTSQIAREIAIACRLSSRSVEDVCYAALLHDIHMIGSEKLGGSYATRVIDGVHSLREAARVLRVLEGRLDGGKVREAERLGAYIVALSSDIDMSAVPSLHQVHPPQTGRLAKMALPTDKATAVAAAIRLGYEIPAIT